MSVLVEIVGNTRNEVARRRVAVPRAGLERLCRQAPPARDFEGALRGWPGTVRLIAEVKKASPSRGVLAGDLNPVEVATAYATHGAHAISVLTDEKYFKGSLDDLRAVRGAVDVPLLRKDFTIDEYQLWESRAAGHTAAELDQALAAGSRIVGINNRDLATFETRLETTLALVPSIPPGPIVVSESGFFTAADVRSVARAGAHAVLVGEALVRAGDPAEKLGELTRAVDGRETAS